MWKYILFIALALWPSLATAQNEATMAEALFEDGRRLLDSGQIHEACAKFAESQRIDPGTGTLLNLASCYEKAGRLATAWSTWREATVSARDAGQVDREAHARKKADELRPKLATLNIIVDPQTRADGLGITQNGDELGSAIWGTPLPVDAGLYQIEATAPGYQVWSQEIELADGEAKSIEVGPLLRDVSTPAPAVASQETTNTGSPAPSPEEDTATPSRSSQKTWAYVVGGAGIVGVTVGGIFGAQAIGRNNESYDYCDTIDTTDCTRTGVDLRDQARTSATLSTVFIGVGVAVLATGVTLYLLAPSETTQVALSTQAGGAKLSIGGSF